MSKKRTTNPGGSSKDYRILDTGVERRPRMADEPPSVAGSSTAAGAWGGGGDDGGDIDTGTGSSVGIGTGTSVGIGTGTSVGIGTGTSVGIGVGTSVGIGVGASVGIGVGSSVGIGTGTSVGIGTGTSVGVSANVGSGTDLGEMRLVDSVSAAAGLRQAMLLARHDAALRSAWQTARDTIKGNRLVARDLWRTARIAQPAISPGGKWVAFVKLERLTGGALQHERIFLKRVGSGPGEAEVPLTDGTILADTPVWEPPVLGNASGDAADGPTRILFRARATPADILQLYVVEVELPQSGSVVRIGRCRRLTDRPTHPWAPKWRRFKDRRGRTQSRVYFVAATPETTPAGYDHLEFEDGLVGWWNNLQLPHRKWRFFALDVDQPGNVQDLLGPHQPLLDFVNGVWGCWDVHPGGQEMVWSAVTRDPDANGGGGRATWPNDISLDLWRMRLGAEAGHGSPAPLTPPDMPPKQAEEVYVERGRFDDYMPTYSPCGTFLLYAEKQFSTLPADYPRIVRVNLSAWKPEATEPSRRPVAGADLFDVIKEAPGHQDPGRTDTLLPVAWRFVSESLLLTQFENEGRLELKLLRVPDRKLVDAETNPPIDIFGDSDLGFSTHEFDVRIPSADPSQMAVCAVTSAVTRPPELAVWTGNRYVLPDDENQWTSAPVLDCGCLSRCTDLNGSLQSILQPLESRIEQVPGGERPRPYCALRPSDAPTEDTSGSDFQVITVSPPRENENRLYPLVQLVHGGPASSWLDEFHMRLNASLLASTGYIVAMVNFRGSTGSPGGEFTTRILAPTALAPSRATTPQFLKDLRGAKNGSEVEAVVQAAVKESSSLAEALEHPHFLPRDLRKIARHAPKEDFQELLQLMSADSYGRLVMRSDDGRHQRGGQRWDLGPLEDLDRATSYLIENYPVDRDRLAIIGASYGAFLGARTLGWKDRTHSYRAAVLHAGVYDPLGHYASDAFWVQYDNFGDRPWVRERRNETISTDFDDGDPAHWRRFSRISPLLRSHRLLTDFRGNPSKRPAVLVTHGLNDLRVHWQQSVLLHRMLLDRGLRSRLALYPGLGHRLDQPEPSVQWWSATLEWLRDNGVAPG